MFGYLLNHLFDENTEGIINQFIDSEYHNERFLNIDLSKNIEKYDYLVDSMKKEYKENSYFFTKEELDEFETTKNRMKRIATIEDETEENHEEFRRLS